MMSNGEGSPDVASFDRTRRFETAVSDPLSVVRKKHEVGGVWTVCRWERHRWATVQ